MKTLSLLIALCLAFSPATLAGTLTVGPFGAGADYFHIIDAINAAQPGDVILVRAGEYEHTLPIRIDKSLTILGEGSDVTSFTLHSDSLDHFAVPLTIENLALGDEVRVIGLELRFSRDPSPNRRASITNCLGPVSLADVTVPNSTGSYVYVSATDDLSCLLIENAVQVSLDNCAFQSNNGGLFGASGPGLQANQSNVLINNSRIFGSDAKPIVSLDFPSGSPAISASGSVLRLSHSDVEGGSGAGSDGHTLSPGNGANGVELDNSHLFL